MQLVTEWGQYQDSGFRVGSFSIKNTETSGIYEEQKQDDFSSEMTQSQNNHYVIPEEP